MTERLHEPYAFVIFGASGDLSRRKLMPALYHLASLGYLPEKYAVIGVARTPMTDDAFRDFVKKALEEHAREDKPEDLSGLPSLLPFLHYHAGDTKNVETLNALKG